MSNNLDATYHPGHFCPACDRVYSSRAAADQCAREDAEDDRNQRITRGLE